MARISCAFILEIKGPGPTETITDFVARVEQAMAACTMPALQEFCRQRGFGIEEALLEVAAQVLRLKRHQVEEMLADEAADES
jgi:hypothetical protein